MRMRPLTNAEHNQMRHALGLDRDSTPYRNAFVTYGRDETWEGLCAIGAATRNAFDAADKWVYHVTDAGKAAVYE